MIEQPQKKPQIFALVSPQGEMTLENDLYLRSQGTTTECGGQVIYVIEQALALAEQGHKVDIYARNYRSRDLNIETHPQQPGVRIFHIPTSAPHEIVKEKFYPYYPEYATNMLDVIESLNLKYDAIVGNYADGMTISSIVEKALHKIRGANTTLIGITHSLGIEKAETLHEGIMENPALSRMEKFNRFNQDIKNFNIKARLGCELAAMSMDGIAGVSLPHIHSLASEYFYPEDRLCLLPGGVNVSVFDKTTHTESERRALRQRLVTNELMAGRLSASDAERINKGQVVLGFGRLVHAKGVVNAVKSIGHLPQDTVYVYIGGGDPKNSPEAEAMDHARKNGYADRVFFLGNKTQKDAAQWMNAVNVYLHAAHLEPWGLAPMEAASTGVPVVISKNAGCRFLLADGVGSLHINPHSPQDIAEKINRYLADEPFARETSERARDIIRTKCTWSGGAARLVTFVNAMKDSGFENRGPGAYNQYKNDALSLLLERKPKGIVADVIKDMFSNTATEMSPLLGRFEQPSSPPKQEFALQ